VGRIQSAYVPRTVLADTSEFGHLFGAPLRTNLTAAEFDQAVASLVQHRAACVVVERREVGEFTSRALAERLGIDVGMMSRYLTGEVPLPFVGLISWARELDDPSVLPDLDEVWATVRAAIR
jgi:transcriptional regulator with XRE-family HTH domain